MSACKIQIIHEKLGVEDDDPTVSEIEKQVLAITSSFFSIKKTLNVLSASYVSSKLVIHKTSFSNISILLSIKDKINVKGLFMLVRVESW